MNAYVCSNVLHGHFAHTLLAREKKVGYFLNRPRMLLLQITNLTMQINENDVVKLFCVGKWVEKRMWAATQSQTSH